MKLIFILISGVILIFNLYPRPRTAFEIAKQKPNHAALAQIFLQNNDYERAKQEHALGARAQGLGASELVTDLDKIKMEIKKWEELTNKYPNFRDGFIQLALLHWRLFDQPGFLDYLQLARELDPNWPLLEQLSLRLPS